VARFQADLDAEKARLSKIRAEGPLEISKAVAEREELQVQIKLAQKMLERNQELNKKGFVSTTVLDQAQERLEVLLAGINLANEELKLKQSQLINNSRLAEAMVDRAAANLNEEEIQLTYASITAPIDGIVAFVSTQEGETVVASLNAPTFVNLIDLRKLEVTVFVDETDIGRIKVGQGAKFTVDTFSNHFFDGRVREIHPKAVIKDNVVNYEVILDIEEKKVAKLRPEMTANVVITTGTRKKVLTLPKEAIKRKGKKTFIVMKFC
jgi:multidrug resistance efflux pump